MPAGCSRSSPRRRAFFILLPRQLGRFGCAGGEFASVCPLAAAILHLAGVHFSFCISAGMVVSTVMGRNLPPYARWPLSFFAMPACIFHPISPPAWPFRLCRHGISPRVPAGRSRSLPRRRAFSSRFPAGMVVSTVTGRNFVTLCPLAAVVLRHAGVHFLFCFLAGMAVSTVPAGN